MKTRRLLFLSVLIVALLVGSCSLWVWQAKRQYTLDRELIAALAHNDTKQALVLVNAGADPNTRFMPTPAPTLKQLLQQCLRRRSLPPADSPSAFMLVCGWEDDDSAWSVHVQNDVSLVQTMLLNGADVNARTTGGQTVLLGAVLNQRADAVKLLLEHGVQVNEPALDGTTALMIAERYKQKGIIRALLAHGANVRAANSDGDTALHWAVTMDRDIVEQLLALGADPSFPNKRGETAIMYAQQQHRPDIVALLRKGAK